MPGNQFSGHPVFAQTILRIPYLKAASMQHYRLTNGVRQFYLYGISIKPRVSDPFRIIPRNDNVEPHGKVKK